MGVLDSGCSAQWWVLWVVVWAVVGVMGSVNVLDGGRCSRPALGLMGSGKCDGLWWV